MHENQNVRVKSICIIKNSKNELLLSADFDKAKKDYYYRPLGGHVEFNEHSIDTVKREFLEEINAEICNLNLLTVLENIFVCDGIPGHEIIFVYTGDFKDKTMYDKNKLSFMSESNGQIVNVYWTKIEDCLSGKYRFVPDDLKRFLNKL